MSELDTTESTRPDTPPLPDTAEPVGEPREAPEPDRAESPTRRVPDATAEPEEPEGPADDAEPDAPEDSEEPLEPLEPEASAAPAAADARPDNEADPDEPESPEPDADADTQEPEPRDAERPDAEADPEEPETPDDPAEPEPSADADADADEDGPEAPERPENSEQSEAEEEPDDPDDPDEDPADPERDDVEEGDESDAPAEGEDPEAPAASDRPHTPADEDVPELELELKPRREIPYSPAYVASLSAEKPERAAKKAPDLPNNIVHLEASEEQEQEQEQEDQAPAAEPVVETEASPEVDGTEASVPPEAEEVQETSTKVERPDIEHMYDPEATAVEYGDPIKELGVPLFEGDPAREQVTQGRLGDCGIIATIGASASARPDVIKDAVKENPDGTYSVTVHQVEFDGDGYVPGAPLEMTVTPDLPVVEGAPDYAAYAAVEQVAWPAVLEKAAAGIDGTWSEERRDQWAGDWVTQKDQMLDANEALAPEALEGPVPTGYGRLNQGSTAYEQAELLAQLTGEASHVVTFPQGEGAEVELEQRIKEKLSAGNPVIVGTRGLDAANGEEYLPKDLVDDHAYEVVSCDDGTVMLHNPWNSTQPEPLTVPEFMEYCQSKDYPGQYVTLR
ncbi:hypothetical protein GCM10010302_19400 [Streptomyces polychromogenes]|uniref:Calpain catalytic domain-containing protein n=1 Tax=Streptomyces polychromogenes TaxID=67342 RepID=A0ABP3EYP0_9ACTN